MESWLDEYEAAITICDLHGIILYIKKPRLREILVFDLVF